MISITRHAVTRYVERVLRRPTGEALGSAKARHEAVCAIQRDLERFPIENYDAEIRIPVGEILYLVKDGTVVTVLDRCD
jgi:DNA-binding LytR/AlgR family response regulator